MSSVFSTSRWVVESIRDFMKCVGEPIHQLDVVSPDTVLQAVKLVIHPNTQFFDSLSLHPPTTIDKVFQRGNQYAMLEDDIVACDQMNGCRNIGFRSLRWE